MIHIMAEPPRRSTNPPHDSHHCTVLHPYPNPLFLPCCCPSLGVLVETEITPTHQDEDALAWAQHFVLTLGIEMEEASIRKDCWSADISLVSVGLSHTSRRQID